MSKGSVNLPKTSFSMRANLPLKEPDLIDYWNKISLYKKLREDSKGNEKFVLHDGPPYANGNIHMGTALNKILKDIITKFHQMNGKDSVYVPGWDCHGLPIEWKIEEQYKKNKKNKNDVPIVEFRKECRDFANKWIDVHKKQFQRLGVIGDWKDYYSTMSFKAEAQIVRELSKFLKEGSLYKGYKPVLWSTVEKTALADAEVEYMDHVSDTIYASFPIKKTLNKNLEGCEIIIWTTTPWTIPANKALAYNKNIYYQIIKIEDDGDFKNRKIVVACDLLEHVLKECEIKKFEKLDKLPGTEFQDTICNHPLEKEGYDYDIPMLEANFVTTEQGSGIVHCAPSHGPDDFNLCINNGIQAVETVDDDGKYTKNILNFEGTHVFKANPIIIESLKKNKRLLSYGK
jgi:isoleucyl-tRNA synthetase